MKGDSRGFSDCIVSSLKNDWLEFKSVCGKQQCSESQGSAEVAR
jgi:hypothetical protein